MHIHTRRGLLAACLTLVLSACGTGGGGGGDAAARSGTPRNYTRTDSAVTVVPNTNPGFTATQVVTISNDDAGASRAVVHLASDAGSLASSAGSNGYQIQVTFTAMAPTEAQAREALATMSVAHRDATDPGVLYLDNKVTYAPYHQANNVSRNATVAATLPVALDYALAQDVGSGTSSSSGLSGSEVRLAAGSGNETLSGTWDRGSADAGSGNVSVSGDIAQLAVSSGSGNLQVSVPSLRPTEAFVDSGSGTIDVTVTQGVGAVYDLTADTGSGTATVAVAGTTPSGSQSTNHAHFQSPGYAGGNPKVRVTTRSGSGTNTIHD